VSRILLTIAGSDSGGGAGIQADLRAFWDHGWHGASVITSVTSQNTRGVTRIDPIPVDGVVTQLRAVLDDADVAGIKLGMLGSAACAHAVADVLEALPVRPPIVVDPVLIATSGDRLSGDDVVEIYRTRLAPVATLLTPNHPEAEVLGSCDPRSLAEVLGTAVLVTGGDADGDEVVDQLAVGRLVQTWRNPRIAGGPFHGTGCTLASAITAGFAAGEAVDEAITWAVTYVRWRLEQCVRVGAGAAVLGPVSTPLRVRR
jgi:hydroxymethylpyrimidine/phosphomethylpyrimidine kinase